MSPRLLILAAVLLLGAVAWLSVALLAPLEEEGSAEVSALLDNENESASRSSTDASEPKPAHASPLAESALNKEARDKGFRMWLLQIMQTGVEISDEQLQAYLDKHNNSRDAALAVFLYAPTAERIEALAARFPKDPHIALFRVIFGPDESEEEATRNLVRLDPDNAAAHLFIAARQFSTADDAEQVALMQRLANSYSLETHAQHSVDALANLYEFVGLDPEQAFIAAAFRSPSEPIQMVAEFEAETLAAYESHATSESNRDLATLLAMEMIHAGETLTQLDTSLAGQKRGAQFQIDFASRILAEAPRDSSQAKQLSKTIQTAEALLGWANEQSTVSHTAFGQMGQAEFAEYLRRILADGEIAANAWLINESGYVPSAEANE